MKRFKRVYVEITNVCNLTCSICPGTKRKPEFMPPESFEVILKKIRPFTDYLYLHVMGEPLLHPDFPELLKICETLKFQVNIATNGVLIRKHSAALMKSKALRQINFSIHCLDIQRNSNIPDNYLPDILEFIEEGGKNSKAYFALRLWNLGHGDKLNPALFKQIGKFFNLPFNLEEKTVKEKGINLAPNVFLNIAGEFQWPEVSLNPTGKMPVLHSNPDVSGFCRGLRDHCAILVDGTVVPCCLDKDGITSLGNIFESKFENITGSDKAQKIIVGFSEGKAVEPLCKICEFRKRFSK
jgi:MoaA/NifB/PqqE/SkfB family radical SAM enzyme